SCPCPLHDALRILSPATDLYSLGVVAYECLTGAPPFDGSTPVEVALKHVRDAPPELPSSVPKQARDLIMQLLAKNAADRPANAGIVADRALAIRAALSTGRRRRVSSGRVSPHVSQGRPPNPTIVPRSPALSGFDGTSGADNLATGSVRGRRRTAPAYASAAAALLVFVIVIGS